MTRHVAETDLALYVSGDLSAFAKLAVRFHIGSCESCRTRVETFRAGCEALREIGAELPESLAEGLDWERLSAEMAANIRVGLEAGECVTPRIKKRSVFASFSDAPWRPAALASLTSVALMVLLFGGWWLNMPERDAQSLARAMRAIWHSHGSVLLGETVVEASSSGVELHKDGGSLGVGQDSSHLMDVSVSMKGSASGLYVDPDTGQPTVASVSYDLP